MTNSPFAGCRTEQELRAQLDALNRIAYYAALVLAPAPLMLASGPQETPE